MRTSKAVCFSCRLCFHRRPLAEGLVCPGCRGQLYLVGYYFRAPRRHQVKAWRRIERVAEFSGDCARLVFPPTPITAKARRARAIEAANRRRLEQQFRTCPYCGQRHKGPMMSAHYQHCAARPKPVVSLSIRVKELVDYEGFKRKVLRL